jgi:type II secretory pathway component PulF
MYYFFDSLSHVLMWVLFWFIPLLGFAWVFYYLQGLPLRRQEQGRFVLDLLETSLKMGRSPEQSIVEVSHSRDTSLSLRFHELAAHVESGMTLRRALEQVPHFLPTPIAGMLRAGMEIGNPIKAISACRITLGDGLSQTRGATNYHLLMLFLLNPLLIPIMPFLGFKIFPVYQEIYAGFGAAMPNVAMNTRHFILLLFCFQTVSVIGLYLGVICYIGGVRIRAWLEAGIYPIGDWLVYFTPWKHKRLLRDFSATLALLLDAAIPEAKALEIASEVSPNRVFKARITTALQKLAQGHSLSEVVARLDDTGEFRWRLTNATHGQGSFVKALNGWHESLNAQAFQQEQAAAQLISTSLAIINGVIVGLLAISNLSVINQMYRLVLPR